MARIKHIAIRTDNVEKTASFYKEAFDLKQVGLGRNGVYLSDGHINLAILRRQPEIEGGDKIGLDHLGFKVDDVHETPSALKQRRAQAIPDRETLIPPHPTQA